MVEDKIREILREVKDPEIPVIDCVELGVIREISVNGDRVSVNITPTYSGCPAMKAIEDDVRETLERHGYKDPEINLVFSPPWTTDWISESGRQKLKEYGIAPPDELVQFPRKKILCPFCDSPETILKSEFSGTACKAMHYCNSCLQVFERFKSI